MENIVDVFYITAGGVIFALAICLILHLDVSMERTYNRVINSSLEDEVMWWLNE